MTIKDIARKSGVSTASVSRVINNDPSVSLAMYEKVMKVINEFNYTPNQIGRQLRTTKSFKILVLLPTISNPFYSKIIKGIEDRSSEVGYNAIIAVSNLNKEIEKKYLELLTTKQVDGVISFFSALSFDEINNIAESFPFVQCCECLFKTKTSYVMINNEEAAFEAVSFLVNKGHKRIGMISGSFYRLSEVEREKGYRLALEKNNIPFDENLIVRSEYTYSMGINCCKKLMSLEKPPTAIFAVSDIDAVGALRHLYDIKKIAGTDIDVIGFDNSSISEASIPTLSTVSQPRYELGEISVDLLLSKINDINSINKAIILPHKLILRESAK